MEEEDYGDIADEDFIEAFSQPSQPLLSNSLSPHRRKRRRVSETSDDALLTGRGGQYRQSVEAIGSGDKEGENGKSAKKQMKHKFHEGVEPVPAARILGATQAEAFPNSSPAYQIRGAIYRKPRPEVPKPPSFTAARPNAAPTPNILQRLTGNISGPKTNDPARELEDLPDDAFSSPENGPGNKEPITIGSPPIRNTQASSFPRQRLVAPQLGLRQTTLFGGQAQEQVPASQVNKVHNFIVDLPPEEPTHHKLDDDALKTWVYPINLGAIRDYQYSIVRNGLFNNLLVALPTGLGKTFIAATIMLNYFRWTTEAQIVFVAPTKPLVAQQAEACFHLVGIPKSQTTMLTGEQQPALRADEWAEKRVFFMTPQTLQNDLSSGIADPKKIVLLVVDEAHRATGNYAYVSVVKFMRRFNKSFRVLALTATPGASVEAVQEVVDGLEISKVEIRTEESMDIQQYVHSRNIDQVILDPSDEMALVQEHYSKALQPLVNLLCAQNAYWKKDPMSLTTFGMVTARKQWMASAGRTASFGLKGMMNALFTILGSVAHGIKLLNFHGIGPFYSAVKDLREVVEDGNKGGKYRKQIVEHPEFKKMMDRIGSWIGRDTFVGHPKLTFLCDAVLNHFMDAGEGRLGEDSPPSATRIIVFAEYRDSAEEICRVLHRHRPMVRASVFVGQADSKRSEGMNQAKQLETISDFKSGKINVIVATSIGEEGLDIGQVDLIICYDASASPIRMLQRMGRTGRKRAGHIVLLLMRGKEEESFIKAKDNYEQMQKMISSGARFNFRHDLSVRIIPKSITPIVDKKMIEIPIENTQGPALPVPTRRRPSKARKKPPKKFHMPDDVETGFRKASKLAGGGGLANSKPGVTAKKSTAVPKIQMAAVPPSDSVLLSKADMANLENRYQNIAGDDLQEVTMPDLTSHPIVQRSLTRCIKVQHGEYTKRCVDLFKLLAASRDSEESFIYPYGDREPSLAYLDLPSLVEDDKVEAAAPSRKAAVKKPTQNQKTSHSKFRAPAPTFGDEFEGEAESEGEGDDLVNSEEASEDSEMEASSSLLNFIAEDDEGMVRKRQPLTKSSSPPPAVSPRRKPSSEPVIYELDSDDDSLPDISDFISSKPKPVSRAVNHRTKGRRVVEDDSDE
ncbi:ATP-dependent DNA helicase [Lachnellula occidentalis]|uniref:ATP-dependent DNA helicase n=1 Tax=Lachnellula occidentalis TaxID=215460 RepID=A0A8H8UJN8_9HELO|nr:ATP-dependent DNA helicase [Lachnellula occidentalis]